MQEYTVRKRSLIAAVAVIALVSFAAPSLHAQARGGAPQSDIRLAPRWPDGHVNLGAVPGGEMGLWEATPTQIPLARPDVASDFGLFAADAREPTDPFLAAKPKLSQIPFQPWARNLFTVRVWSRQEPYTRCKPSSGARQVATAYGTQLLEVPEMKRFYIIETGGAHSFRTVYMDRLTHPSNLTPSNRGHSIGRWDGDTLVIDTVGFNEKVWIDNLGMPTTDKLHTIERFTRINYSTITYEITIDDPGAYTAPWKSGFYLRWAPGESFEFVCQENNQAPELIVGEDLTPVAPIPFVP
jgi:hypothetical protein